jgi:glycosyltransferase involved in cell wall biosynthesis
MASIAQITPYYPPHLGGMERVVENLSRGLARHHDVTVLTTDLGAGPEGLRVADSRLDVRRHRAIEVAHTPIAPGLLMSLARMPRSTIVHLHSAHALLPELVALVARMKRQRFLLHFHLDVDGSGRLGWLLPHYKRHVFARVLRAAAGVIVLTDSQADFVHRTYAVPRRRLHVVPNGVGEKQFMSPRRAPVGEPFRLLFVGRLSPQKNVTRLLEAMALCKQPVRLTVVGDGEQTAQLRRTAHELDLHSVTFAGALFGSELRQAYAEADVFVLPSDREGMALVALEAMAAGLPIVATRVPGNVELLRDVAVLAEPSPRGIAQSLDEVVADPHLFERLARRSAAAARSYTWAAVVDRVIDVYTETVA